MTEIVQLRHEAELFDQLQGVHSPYDCDGEVCVIHNASDHTMRTWPIVWRGIFERICIHSCGHPDPDQFPHWIATNQEGLAGHTCCGCCANH